MAAARLRESCAAARRGTLSTGEKTLKSGAPHKTTSSNCHLLATKMTATIIPPFFERREVSNENNKMLNYSNSHSLGEAQLTPVTYSSTTSFSGAPTVLDRKLVGAPSAGGLFQRSHSVSLPAAKFSQFDNSLKTDPCVMMGSSNKENRYCEHSYSELGDQLGSGGQVCVGGSSQVNSSRYKTELCRPFEENGTCKYGDKCQFAHGMQELRSLNRHPKYKTELCRTFHSSGYCPYGPRCNFIHNAEERRGPPPLSFLNKMDSPRLKQNISFTGFPSCGGLQDSPTSITPPPIFSAKDFTECQNNPFTFSSQDLGSLFSPSLGTVGSESQGPALSTPTIPSFFQPMLESPPSLADSLSDQEGYQSSLGSHSSSESSLLDASRRLPIFSRLSINDE
ncbi:mRNA decay activator protein ZFP36L1 [Larimichthys crocea]|nr:mRNA decay activator protein ZFP36L1 [Larimichthys crocea]